MTSTCSTVKPLVLKYAQAEEIEELARRQGLLVGVEYHKRFDRRALDAPAAVPRRPFRPVPLRRGQADRALLLPALELPELVHRDNSDPFTYIGCHYVDLVYFITGLRPVEVAVRGVEGKFPNGNVGYLWSAGQVVWENGAILSVVNGLGYPDEGAGTNDQGLCMFCEGSDVGAIIRHDDQFRGVSHGYVDHVAARPSALSAWTISALSRGKATASSRWAMATTRSRPSCKRHWR